MAVFNKKVCLLGDFAVGKTSLVRRFVYDRFDDKYISTIGVKVSRKTITVPRQNDTVDLNMMLWDLAGGEEFSAVQGSYLRGAAGAILVCDLTRAATLESLQLLAANFLKVNPQSKIVVAANKNDLPEQHVLSSGQVRAVADRLDTTFYLTSAKTGDEVEMLFRKLGQMLV